MLASPGMLPGRGGAAHALSTLPGAAVSWGGRLGLGTHAEGGSVPLLAAAQEWTVPIVCVLMPRWPSYLRPPFRT